MHLKVNDESHEVTVDVERTLLSVLRHELGLTGTKYGCGEGNCGACTVLIDGEATRSCITPVTSAGGRDITTIEGLADGDTLHPVQEAFVEHTAFQCAYCTPGFIMSSTVLLDRNPAPDDEQIRSALSGHICRCGAYVRILKAVKSASSEPVQSEGGAS
ncbi:MAG TPA: (2Fe-2S)-binding protein [Dehalococcoidia bacterium]|jgi:aerobic-type carbon monoxide dehydrogenase small subunit (CoxS/CutS family)|nr:ferredoxin [Chloroflexota bacterium]MDP5877354.1 (2Fe-2S)-binding protein [Dehalococcoidia bacterium]MDP7160015.1 (2Fe-2S)-binding protein [Dehalococcoidia bacterium]MDP7212368.1 (2Fe-2S)-binding protein [Dehalococcoidia bacterium]MDP7513836.1 (2Fe-2S)-binding protein [Dehalococcoidia bacterium]|tara:strand:+ start:4295 stop:4771 length:477 start_codon:yes stop_codon:yes gene_type:complete